jgi:hypothetical protein
MVAETNDEILCGTSESDIVAINTDSFKTSVLSKGHSSEINDAFFPPKIPTFSQRVPRAASTYGIARHTRNCSGSISLARSATASPSPQTVS